MQYYLTLTSECNLRCKYCYEKCCNDFGAGIQFPNIDYSVPSSAKYDIVDLERFLARDPEASVIFYGGEPLLRIGLLEKIMRTVPAKKFILQTNGMLLHRLDSEYLNKLDTILVSIDGDRELTNYYRGKGVYEQVVKNLRQLRDEGFVGEMIARMTVGGETKIDRAVRSLIFNEDLFDSIHWQLDALFWHNDYDKDGFARWAKAQYIPEVRNLIELWVRHMRDHREVLRIYPFVGIMRSLLLNEPSKLRCGAGWTMFNIQTDGNITPCPVMAGMKDFYLGNIEHTDPRDLTSRAVFASEPCTDCAVYSICGGRCLYANVTKLWGEEGFRLVCSTVEDLIDALRSTVATIQRFVSEGTVLLGDFDYPRYNSCEIIP